MVFIVIPSRFESVYSYRETIEEWKLENCPSRVCKPDVRRVEQAAEQATKNIRNTQGSQLR